MWANLYVLSSVICYTLDTIQSNIMFVKHRPCQQQQCSHKAKISASYVLFLLQFNTPPPAMMHYMMLLKCEKTFIYHIVKATLL